MKRLLRRAISLVLLSGLVWFVAGCGMFGLSIHGSGNVGSAFGLKGVLAKGYNWFDGITDKLYFEYSAYFVNIDVFAGLNPGQFAGDFTRSLIEQGNAPKPKQLTAEQQYWLGRGVSAALVAEYKAAPVTDVRTQLQIDYLNGMGGYIYSSAPDGSSLWAGVHIGILDTPDVAAYATPGGFVWVSRGALDICQAEDELAALVAHELGHMAMEHSIAAYHKDTGGKIRVDLALLEASQKGAERFNPALGSYVRDQARRVRDDPYTEDQEYQADQWAIATLQLAGYSHTAMYRLLERVEAWEKAHPTSSKYLKNHPPVKSRVGELKDFVNENDEVFQLKVSATATAAQKARFSATFKIG